jgi:hypothetical protein
MSIALEPAPALVKETACFADNQHVATSIPKRARGAGAVELIKAPDGSRGRKPVDKSRRDQTVRQIRAAFREPRRRQGVYVLEQADRRDVDIAERARADARASPANRPAGSY